MDHAIYTAVKDGRLVSDVHTQANLMAARINTHLALAVQNGEAGPDYSKLPVFARKLPQFVPPKNIQYHSVTLPNDHSTEKRATENDTSRHPQGQQPTAGFRRYCRRIETFPWSDI